jgi:hypothetical protein
MLQSDTLYRAMLFEGAAVPDFIPKSLACRSASAAFLAERSQESQHALGKR